MVNIPVPVIQAAVSAMQQYRVPASVSLAQWALESGWGAHSPGNNPFGMKPRKNMDDYSQLLWTTEWSKDKGTYKTQQPFRKFLSIADAFRAHAQLLSTAPVYAPAMACLPQGGCPTEAAKRDFIHKMAARYATDQLYESKLLAIIEGNGLWAHDL